MRDAAPLPKSIAGIFVPQDETSSRAWSWAQRNVPDYLLTHSVRAYFWGAAIAAGEGWSFDGPILWTAALFHDFGLTRIPRNRQCFEVEGADVARRFAIRNGMSADEATRVASAIVMHMQATVTLDDGVESVLLDRATGLDVRGDGYSLVDTVRQGVMAEFPRRAFDRRFLAAISREVAIRPGCQSDRLLNEKGLAGWMERSMAICAMSWDGAGTRAAPPQ